MHILLFCINYHKSVIPNLISCFDVKLRSPRFRHIQNGRPALTLDILDDIFSLIVFTVRNSMKRLSSRPINNLSNL